MKNLLLIMFLGINIFTFNASEIDGKQEEVEVEQTEFFAGEIIEKDGEKKVISKDVVSSNVSEVLNDDESVVDYPSENDLELVLRFYNQYKGTDYIQGTREEFLTEIIAGAVQKGISYEQYLKEYAESVEVPVKGARKTVNDFANMTPPKSSVGNILYVDTISTWNHVGIYHSAEYYMDAPGPGRTVRYTQYTTKQPVKKGRRMQVLKVNTTSTVKKAAAKYAYSQRGKQYDNNFATNKSNTSSSNKKFNCSELVYKAYRYNESKSINLDSDGGAGVYPDDIYKSKLTTSIWKSTVAWNWKWGVMKKKKILICVLVFLLIITAYFVYKAKIYKTKFKIESINDEYDIALITSSYDALKGNLNSYQYNELYLLSEDNIYNKRTNSDTWPTSNNLALVNDEIIFENYNNVIKFVNDEVQDNQEQSTDIYFANYLDKYITENNKVIFNAINELKVYDSQTGLFTKYQVNDFAHQVIGYNESDETIISIYMTDDDQYYYSVVSQSEEDSVPLSNYIPELDNSYVILGGIDNGEKLVTYKYVDYNTVDTLFPFQVWDLKTGELEKIIEPEISNEVTNSDMIPEAYLGGSEYIVTLTRNGFIYKTSIKTGETSEYNISHLELTTEDTTYIQYIEEDDSIYLISQPLNSDEPLEIYDVSEDQSILNVKINRGEQFYSGFIVNNKNK